MTGPSLSSKLLSQNSL